MRYIAAWFVIFFSTLMAAGLIALGQPAVAGALPWLGGLSAV